MSTATEAARERENRRTDITHEIVAPWVDVPRVTIESIDHACFAWEDGAILSDGKDWLRAWFESDPRHSGPIRCIAMDKDAGNPPVLYALNQWTGERAVLPLHPAPPEPDPEHPPLIERTMRISLCSIDDAATEGRFIAEMGRGPDVLPLIGVGNTPGQALASLGDQIDSLCIGRGWDGMVAPDEEPTS